MPQATPELQAKFPGSDAEALGVIEKNFTVSRDWVIRLNDRHYYPTEREWDAVHYLCDEWDFAYESLLEGKTVTEIKEDGQ